MDISFYHKELSGLSASDIKLIWRSPAHYLQNKLRPPEPTKVMALGSAIHMAVLEPIEFRKRYAVLDDVKVLAGIDSTNPKSTVVYKQWKEGFLRENQNKMLLSVEDYDKTLGIAEAIQDHPIAGQLLSENGLAETVLQWVHQETGTQMKARPDWLLPSCGIIDIKTCEDARPAAFARSVWNYLYHIQAAVYREGVHMTKGSLLSFIFIAVERNPPFGIMVYEMDEKTLELADSEVDRCIRVYENCLASGIWPNYPPDIKPLSLPAWSPITD
jgi:exodeoxyribonuclease VIII